MSRTSAESRHVDDPNPRTEAPSSHASGPAVHHLGITQCRALLARNRTGRIAFALDNRVDIEPIHFVYHDGWIFGRTSPGTKAAALRHTLQVLLDAAANHPRILKDPGPVSRLMSFEDYGMRVEVRFWIRDPMNGVNNVRLMTAANFQRFTEQLDFKYVGGVAKKSPLRIAVPENGHWHLVVDMEGHHGLAESSVKLVAAPRSASASEPGPSIQMRSSAAPSCRWWWTSGRRGAGRAASSARSWRRWPRRPPGAGRSAP